jgi:hypothetical protein
LANCNRRGNASEPLDQRRDRRTTTVRYAEMDRPVSRIATIGNHVTTDHARLTGSDLISSYYSDSGFIQVYLQEKFVYTNSGDFRWGSISPTRGPAEGSRM